MTSIIDILNQRNIGLKEFIEILVVLSLGIFLLRKVKKGILMNILLAILILNIAYFIAYLLNLRVIKFLLEKILSVGIIGIIIVFQPEIRRFITNYTKYIPFVKKYLFRKKLKTISSVQQAYHIEQIGKTIKYLINNRLGGLIVIHRDKMDAIQLQNAVIINGEITCRLLESIFEKNSPLHDGAVLLESGKVIASRVVLPLSDNETLPRRIGLRHRAGIGASESLDALIIIISEERHSVSYAIEGKLYQDVSIENLNQKLEDYI
jgi:uncharacterized protein (TIGR00159 family)